MSQLKVTKFSGKTNGPNLLFFGCIHGNETCGYHAIENIIKKIQRKQIIIDKGSITFVPICNPEAFEKKERFIDVNLNRIFSPSMKADGYEAGLVTQLTSLIDQCDVFVDIHSASQAIQPFSLQFQKTDESYKLSEVIGFQDILFGEDIVPPGNITTQHYAKDVNKTACLIECGQHNDPDAIKHAEGAIYNVMQGYGVTSFKSDYGDADHRYHYDLCGYVTYDRPGRLTKAFQTFDFIEKDGLIGVFKDGIEQRAPDDVYLIMPCETPPLGEQWFYFAKRKEVKNASNK